jgi:hypothetical protein
LSGSATGPALRAPAKQIADQLPGAAQTGGGRFDAPLAAVGYRFCQHRQSQLAVALGDLQLDRVAAPGGKGQGEGDAALVDQRAVGAVGQQRLDFSQQALSDDEAGKFVGNLLSRRRRPQGEIGSRLQAVGDVGADHGR